MLLVIVDSLEALRGKISELDRQIGARARSSELAHRLMTIAGVGPSWQRRW